MCLWVSFTATFYIHILEHRAAFYVESNLVVIKFGSQYTATPVNIIFCDLNRAVDLAYYCSKICITNTGSYCDIIPAVM